MLLLLLREAFFSGPYLPLAKPHDGMILDMHCHVAGIGAGGSGCVVSRELRNNFWFNIYMKAFGVTLAEVEEQGDQLLMERLAKGIEESKRVGAAIGLAMDGVIAANGRLDRRCDGARGPCHAWVRDAAGARARGQTRPLARP